MFEVLNILDFNNERKRMSVSDACVQVLYNNYACLVEHLVQFVPACMWQALNSRWGRGYAQVDHTVCVCLLTEGQP